MNPSRATWLGWTALLVAVVLIVVALTVPAEAQECVSIADDKATAERAGLEYLGVRDVPWADAQMVFYRRGDNMTLISRVINGCVEPAAHPVGAYRAETAA